MSDDFNGNKSTLLLERSGFGYSLMDSHISRLKKVFESERHLAVEEVISVIHQGCRRLSRIC